MHLFLIKTDRQAFVFFIKEFCDKCIQFYLLAFSQSSPFRRFSCLCFSDIPYPSYSLGVGEEEGRREEEGEYTVAG